MSVLCRLSCRAGLWRGCAASGSSEEWRGDDSSCVWRPVRVTAHHRCLRRPLQSFTRTRTRATSPQLSRPWESDPEATHAVSQGREGQSLTQRCTVPHSLCPQHVGTALSGLIILYVTSKKSCEPRIHAEPAPAAGLFASFGESEPCSFGQFSEMYFRR